MALLLAPYNDVMRLGMGFNSFTQQLCINDAVKLAGGHREPASERSLRPQYKLGTMTFFNGGNIDISQDVTWTAKFVDRISEVPDSLNISGSLQIKCDAVGSGGKASASFVDTNKFKESDINYLIQVRITNQRLTALDLVDFDPIPNIPDSEFARVYGDSFISGFTEGGEFNALISIKLKDRSTAKEIKGKLEVEVNFKVAQVTGEGDLEKTDASKLIEGETTIASSWRGGGDIKDGTVSDWTLETLKAVAMEFPEHVMACPMRTNTILTKYTSLKSFYEKGIRGTPLDYENAGVYSSALLDAYMDYKIMWRNIQQVPTLAPAVVLNTMPSPTTTVVSTVALPLSQHSPPEPPIPPNNLVPYKGSIFRLDKARRDCRFEMIKIVREELDAVADNPKVACDLIRAWQYLSPAIFRMLLPVRIRNVSTARSLVQCFIGCEEPQQGKGRAACHRRGEKRYRRPNESARTATCRSDQLAEEARGNRAAAYRR
ncbi:hypothetical protein DFH07DRAFT_750169 [Mycena maculata]|uniref:Uncharacterized protein n=1 Tax=Mycena maculata TaxID=230809 RepID=A0AAD7IJ41_9AGAR|nr:hypothetical protein DFH07DRAFT_750169 [Mycena maculata]